MKKHMSTIAFAIAAMFIWAGCAGQQSPSAAEEKGGDAKDEISTLPELSPVKHGWVDPSVKLASYGNVWIDPIQNTSAILDTKLMESLKSDFERAVQATGKKAAHGGLKMAVSVTKIERAEVGKAFIPFAGMVAWQAAIGADVVVTEERSGKVVAKMRHFVRRGQDLSAIGSELVDAIVQAITTH